MNTSEEWPLTSMAFVLNGCLEKFKYEGLLICIRDWHFTMFSLCKSE